MQMCARDATRSKISSSSPDPKCDRTNVRISDVDLVEFVLKKSASSERYTLEDKSNQVKGGRQDSRVICGA